LRRHDATGKKTMLEMAIGVTMWIGLGTLAALAVGRASRIGRNPAKAGARRAVCPPHA
jgi:hypothetical protein